MRRDLLKEWSESSDLVSQTFGYLHHQAVEPVDAFQSANSVIEMACDCLRIVSESSARQNDVVEPCDHANAIYLMASIIHCAQDVQWQAFLDQRDKGETNKDGEVQNIRNHR